MSMKVSGNLSSNRIYDPPKSVKGSVKNDVNH